MDHYLILHSEHEAALDKPWQVIRCWHGSTRQHTLFEGPRNEAKAYLANHWEDEVTL